MGIRETLNARPGLAAAIGGAMVLAAVPLMMWANGGPPGRATTAYYSDDNGKTFFVDAMDKVYPFDRNGKPAYRAQVYQCGDGKPFVAYLSRIPDGAKARLAQLEKRRASDPEVVGHIADLLSAAVEVKRPADEEWVPMLSGQAGDITRHPDCPGGGTASPVSP